MAALQGRGLAYLAWYCNTTFLLCYFAIVGAILHTTRGRAVIVLVGAAMLVHLIDGSGAARLFSALGNTLSLIGFYLLGTGREPGWTFIGLGALVLLAPLVILIFGRGPLKARSVLKENKQPSRLVR